MVAKREFYDYGPILSYNCDYNVIAGPRGTGKTFGFIKMCVNAWIKNREEFIYIRRYKDDISKSASLFFDAIAPHFPDWDFRTRGGVGQMAEAETRGVKGREWHTVVYFIALSTAQQYKSVPFPRVTRIGYDEFIIEKGNVIYLKNEVAAFNNLVNTVDRYRESLGQKPVRVFLMANAVSATNPFFIEWQIRPEDGKEWQRRYDNFLVVHLHKPSERFLEDVQSTRFGRFLMASDPEYAAYAMDNKFADAHGALIGPKTENAKYRYTLEMARQTVSVWYDLGNRNFYVQRKRPKGNEYVFTLDRAGVAPGVVYLEYGSKVLSAIRTAYNHHRVIFDMPETRNLFLDVFKRT